MGITVEQWGESTVIIMNRFAVSPFQDLDQITRPMDPSLRESRRRIEVIDTIHVIEDKTRQDQAKLRDNLQILANDTKEHEEKLRLYREQLQLRLKLNEQQWKAKIVQMLEEFERLKENLDESKLRHLLALKRLRLKTNIMAAFIKKRGRKVDLRLKEEELRRCLMSRLIGKLCEGKGRDNILEFTQNVIDMRNKQMDFNQLVLNFMRNNLERAKKLAGERKEYIYKEAVPAVLSMELVNQIHVQPTKDSLRDLSVIRANYKQKKKAKRRKVRPPRKIIIEAEQLLTATQAAGGAPVSIHVVLEKDNKPVHVHKRAECPHSSGKKSARKEDGLYHSIYQSPRSKLNTQDYPPEDYRKPVYNMQRSPVGRENMGLQSKIVAEGSDSYLIKDLEQNVRNLQDMHNRYRQEGRRMGGGGGNYNRY